MDLSEWTIDVDGHAYHVTVTPTPKGTNVVRVDGRAIARPMGPDEKERIVPLGGALYVLTRDADGEFSLFQHETLTPSSSGGAAARLPHRISDMPLGFKSKSTIRMSAIAWGTIVILTAVGLWYAIGPSYEKLAVSRVEEILADMGRGTGAEVQFAVGLWSRNVRVISDRDELSWASDNFDIWRREKNLYRTFESWRIVESRILDGDVPTALVIVEIEGTRYGMIVPERQPITWADLQ
jgi:hypothetical protein